MSELTQEEKHKVTTQLYKHLQELSKQLEVTNQVYQLALQDEQATCQHEYKTAGAEHLALTLFAVCEKCGYIKNLY